MKKPITLPARPQTKVHRGVDRVEPETGAEMGGIRAEAVIGVGAEHDQALDEQNEGEPHHPHHEWHAGDLDQFLDRVLVVLVDLRFGLRVALLALGRHHPPLGFALLVCFRA